jgi:hypothetical protein
MREEDPDDRCSFDNDDPDNRRLSIRAASVECLFFIREDFNDCSSSMSESSSNCLSSTDEEADDPLESSREDLNEPLSLGREDSANLLSPDSENRLEDPTDLRRFISEDLGRSLMREDPKDRLSLAGADPDDLPTSTQSFEARCPDILR